MLWFDVHNLDMSWILLLAWPDGFAHFSFLLVGSNPLCITKKISKIPKLTNEGNTLIYL